MPNSGILLIDKPQQMTSHDLVNIARKVFHTKKIGHNGTLDPDATGVMLLSINQATRLNEYLAADDKQYQATISFGQETDTQDISGNVISTCATPSMSENEFKNVLLQFLGHQKQIPPMYSAIKKDGKPLYKYARQGIQIDNIEARDIFVHSIECLSYSKEQVLLNVKCSKGTYIRTLCQDIARACDSCGCMSSLRRTQVSHFSINECCTLEELKTADDPYQLLIPMADALEMPEVRLSTLSDVAAVHNGKKIPVNSSVDFLQDTLLKVTYNNELISVGNIIGNQFVPKKVFKQ